MAYLAFTMFQHNQLSCLLFILQNKSSLASLLSCKKTVNLSRMGEKREVRMTSSIISHMDFQVWICIIPSRFLGLKKKKRRKDVVSHPMNASNGGDRVIFQLSQIYANTVDTITKILSSTKCHPQLIIML